MGHKYNPELGVVAVVVTCGVAWAAGCLGAFIIAGIAGVAACKVVASRMKGDLSDAYSDAENALAAELDALSDYAKDGKKGKELRYKLQRLAQDRASDERNAMTMGKVAGVATFANPIIGAAGLVAAHTLQQAGKRERKKKGRRKSVRKMTAILPAEAIVL